MATSKSKPTAGEVTQNDVPEDTNPKIQDAPVETNFPAPVAENEVQDSEDEVEEFGEKDEIWAVWVGQQPSQRTLTVADLKSLGDVDATEPLVWDRNNRFRVNVTLVHPMVLEYIEKLDDGFEVVRPK